MRVRWYCLFGYIALWLAIYSLAMYQFEPGTPPPTRFVIYQEKQVESDWRMAVDFKAMQQFLDELGGPTIGREHIRISAQPKVWYLQLTGFAGMTNPITGIDLHLDSNLSEFHQAWFYHELIHFAHFARPWEAPAWFCVWLFVAPAVYFLWLAPVCLKFPVVTRGDRMWRGIELALLAYLCLWIVPYYLDPEELYAYHFSHTQWGQGAPPLMSDMLGESDIPLVTKSGDLAWMELDPKKQIRPLYSTVPLFWVIQHALSNILFWTWICWGVMVFRRRRHPRPAWSVSALWVLVGCLTLYTFQHKFWIPACDIIETQIATTCFARSSLRGSRLAADGQSMTNFGRFLYQWEPPTQAVTPPPKPPPIWVDRHYFKSKDGREFTIIFTLVNFNKPQETTLSIQMPQIVRQQFSWLDKDHLLGKSLEITKGASWASATWQLANRGHAQVALRLWRDKKDLRSIDEAMRDMKIRLYVDGQTYEVPGYRGY